MSHGNIFRTYFNIYSGAMSCHVDSCDKCITVSMFLLVFMNRVKSWNDFWQHKMLMIGLNLHLTCNTVLKANLLWRQWKRPWAFPWRQMMFNGALCHALTQTSGCGKNLQTGSTALEEWVHIEVPCVFQCTLLHSSALLIPPFSSLSLPDAPLWESETQFLITRVTTWPKPWDYENQAISLSLNLFCFLLSSPFIGFVSFWMDTTP